MKKVSEQETLTPPLTCTPHSEIKFSSRPAGHQDTPPLMIQINRHKSLDEFVMSFFSVSKSNHIRHESSRKTRPLTNFRHAPPPLLSGRRPCPAIVLAAPGRCLPHPLLGAAAGRGEMQTLVPEPRGTVVDFYLLTQFVPKQDFPAVGSCWQPKPPMVKSARNGPEQVRNKSGTMPPEQVRNNVGTSPEQIRNNAF